MTECRADTFEYTDKAGQMATLDGELVASEQGFHLIQTADGAYHLVPQDTVQSRKPQEPPKPLTTQELAKQLQEKYTPELFRYDVLGQYMVGLVLAAPLPKSSETRCKQTLDRGTAFLKRVDTAFSQFLREAKLTSTPPKYPMVCLVFETDKQFDEYSAETTGRSTSGSSVVLAGFYSKLNNRLAIRLTECTNFETPFHEAIHQQVYNRGLLQRMAPVPAWFDEGIATGFEASKEKVTANPNKVSPRYARQALLTDNFSWEQMHADDRVFRGDVLVNEAYGQAWGLHWLLITKYKAEYQKYLKTLSAKTPLSEDTPDQRRQDFSGAFKKSLKEMEKEFPDVLTIAARKQKVSTEPPKPPGVSLTEAGMGKAEVFAVSVNGDLQVEGKLQNLSPLRPMTFHVMVITDGGTYADWLIDNLDVQKIAPLPRQAVQRRLRNVQPTGVGRRFSVMIRSSPTESDEARAWKSGQLSPP